MVLIDIEKLVIYLMHFLRLMFEFLTFGLINEDSLKSIFNNLSKFFEPISKSIQNIFGGIKNFFGGLFGSEMQHQKI